MGRRQGHFLMNRPHRQFLTSVDDARVGNNGSRCAPTSWRRWLLTALTIPFLLGVFGTSRLAAGEASLTEYQVKALFLLNFTKYVTWPSNAFAETNSPFAIGIYGEDKFGEDLEKALAGKNVGGRSIVIQSIKNADDSAKCQIVFISNSEKKRTPEIVAQLQSAPVLTVGETELFTDQGGIINLSKKEGKVRLEINLQAAQLANLQISSKLLTVADVVKGKTK
jgi:YfiR/HmsC-like